MALRSLSLTEPHSCPGPGCHHLRLRPHGDSPIAISSNGPEEIHLFFFSFFFEGSYFSTSEAEKGLVL